MKQRYEYLDRLKIFMTALVILHHTAISYGGSGSWYYVESDGGIAGILLSLFNVVNQSFFMGLFFFISGYVTPGSYDRKGPLRFMKDRIVRFGLPLLLFMILITPVLRYISSGYEGSFGAFASDRYMDVLADSLNGFEVGPLWFVFALLMMNALYATYRLVDKRERKTPELSVRIIAGYLVLVGIANFLVRIFMPIGEEWMQLQLGYFPAYIGLFIGGMAAYRGGWLEKLTTGGARKAGWIATSSFLLLPVSMVAGGALEGDTSAFEGGLTWQAAFYSLNDPVMGLAISYGLLVRFRDRWNAPNRLGTWLSANAFGAYVLHALVATYLAYGVRGLELAPLLKFAFVGSVAVALSFVGAWAIRCLPGARRIL